MPFYADEYLWAMEQEGTLHGLQRSHLPLGYHPKTGDKFLMPDADRYAGTYVLGVQGSGKSAFIQNLSAFDEVMGHAIIVIDPHGDLVRHIVAQLPWERLKQTYILDMEDEAYPFGVNLLSHAKLQSSVEWTTAIERIQHVFEVVWPEVEKQQYLPLYLSLATTALLYTPGTTLVDLLRFLLEDNFRAQILRNVSDSSVIEFWHNEYDELKTTERMRRVQALITRLRTLFTGRSLMRNLLGQSRTSINFRQAIENREIILIPLPVKKLGHNAELVGTILLARIHAAIFSFSDLAEKDRPGVSLYVDEVQHFATPDFSELFTEGRKFGVKVTIAHQFRGQLPEFLQRSTTTARTKICFQTTPDDAREMAHFFPSSAQVIKPEDIDSSVTGELLKRPSVYGREVESFVTTYLAPLQRYRRGRSRVEIVHGGYDLFGGVLDILATPSDEYENLKLDDPTEHLDRLLHDVMYYRDATLPIRREIPMGFCNSGRGFLAPARNADSRDLTMEVFNRLPRAIGERQPINSKEQFYHFIYSLRRLMQYLGEHPIGKVTKSSETEVNRLLSNLKRRTALVRSSNDVGIISTFDTLEPVDDRQLAARLERIRTQTREKYCHPRQAVEQGLIVAARPTSAPYTRPLPAPKPAVQSFKRYEEL